MHTLPMRARQHGRWRWIAAALAVIAAQGLLAVALRSGLGAPSLSVRGAAAAGSHDYGRSDVPRP